jgi:hypothetical protein
MRITQLRKNITEMVEVSDDKEALQVVFEILEDRSKNKGKDILDDLSPADLKRLDKSLEQIEKRQVVSHEEVMKRLKAIVKNGEKGKLV